MDPANAMLRVRGLRNAVQRRLLELANLDRFERDFLRVLPARLVPAARWAHFHDWTPEERTFVREVESFRARIADVAGQPTIEIKG